MNPDTEIEIINPDFEKKYLNLLLNIFCRTSELISPVIKQMQKM